MSRNSSAIRLPGKPRSGRRTRLRALADSDQILAGIHTFGDFADVLAERLAVTHVQRAGERIDLRAGIVDVIFLGDPESRRLKQPREAIADHRAAAMAHVHRPGRVGRDIFDVDPLVLADLGQAVFLALTMIVRSSSRHASGSSRRLMKPGPAISTDVTGGIASSLGAIASASARGFVPAAFARTIAALVARSPCDGSRGGSTATLRAVEFRRQDAFGDKIIEHSVEERGILGVKAQGQPKSSGKRGL